MKKKILITILALGLLTGCGKSIPKLSNGEEALIEFKDGTKYSVNEIWNELKETYALDIALAKIDEKIFKEEFKDQVDDIEKELEAQEAQFKLQFVDEDGNFDENNMLLNLRYYGYNSLEEYMERQRTYYYEDLATENYAKSKITDKQINKYYKDEAIGDINCVHILVRPASTSSEDDTKALNKAKEIITAINKDVKSGTSKLDAFKKYESDSSVTYQDLGYFNKGDMVEAFETAALKLKNDSYSTTPVKTSYGYHIIYRIDQKEKPSLEDAREDIITTLANKLIDEDGTTSVNAMIELRKKYGLTWYDSEMENAYNTYMNYLINNAN